ncbi:acetyl/acyl transferase [Amycolatopsis sp. K13G38]|uniref:Acetyl/acyl transferase n=1 Tax=Amycolatopsis acididurans TaxID=2724524 RepID=A0ABX1JB77_9PSEU|nr:DapH/DapD/GlmU-related protein [Amycolatopsis acididurans]NKQ55615.1 acetyl/acyl transferase [Amycolatopsis acididurans]
MNIDSLYAAVQIADSSIVGEHCTLGFPKEARVRAEQQQPGTQNAGEPTVVGKRCLLANQVVLYEGVQVGHDCLLEDRVRVGYNSRIGDRSRIVYGAYVCDRVTIGADARVAGFVCDGTVIGDRSTVMGELVHEYARPHQGWWDVDEDSPVVEPDSVVGYGSRVVGGVTIGPRSYVAAGAIVTRNVPPEHVVTGVNVHTPAHQWTGRRLQDLIRQWS